MRVRHAHDRGIYVMVMLFHGFSVENKRKGSRPNPWPGHPFNAANNVNGIDGDLNGNGEGEETHTLAIPAVTRLQEAYVRKVIDTVNDLDVLYEIANESHRASAAWQQHMVDYIHAYERSKPKQNPVVLSSVFDGGRGQAADIDLLFASRAEAVAPGSGSHGEYKSDPPAADGRKVVIADTDHLWGVGGDPGWVWKSFLRGLNPIFMDPIDEARWIPVRKAMGQTRNVAARIDLARMVPHVELASSGYCLADPGIEYLVYLPTESDRREARIRSWIKSTPILWRFADMAEYVRLVANLSVEVELPPEPTAFRVAWLDPVSGRQLDAGEIRTAGRTLFTAPFIGPAVLHLAPVTPKR
jgi:hypothetical protein